MGVEEGDLDINGSTDGFMERKNELLQEDVLKKTKKKEKLALKRR